jgi:putative DNA modification/repair radical SAM protein
VQEVVDLTIGFYRRNYIEGLFLSSGIIRSPDHTMEQLVEVARKLREEHGFKGYIHLKTIPDADPEIVAQAGLWADRVSINIELPTTSALTRLAPDKSEQRITSAMADMKASIAEAKDASRKFKSAPRFAPAGQSTQMIVGADAATDVQIIDRASSLYQGYGMRRVYYSAFSPIPDASAVLPLKRPPLMREHRLYQSDWLMRFYGYEPFDIRDASDNGMLPLDIDPKLAWALKFRDTFPVDVNRAERERLLRVPGLGVKAVKTILDARRYRTLRLDDVARLTQSIAKVRPFIVAADWRPTLLTDRSDLRRLLAPPEQQLELFAA